VRRGDNFSSLKELIALYLAGDPPELAAIETSELPALERTHLALPIPQAVAQLAGGKAGARTLPFEKSLPILVADQEVLYRIHADRDPMPRTWEELVPLASKISDAQPGSPPLALPLQGPRGLWIFEALAAKPLWTRETGGLRTNRELESSVQAIQSLLSPRAPELAASEMTWDRALQDFLDRKSPLLVTTLDALPLIARKTSFRWKSSPLPTIGHASPLLMVGGSDLIVTRDRPEVWSILRFLYSKETSARWIPSGGYLPLKPDWQTTTTWKQAPEGYRALAKSAAGAPARSLAARSSDADVVRAHTEWVTALHLLFGETSKRLPTEAVFTQLDATLAR
jgi:ABC-type glycerol-3-phosphate transport system substrate-binding protein